MIRKILQRPTDFDQFFSRVKKSRLLKHVSNTIKIQRIYQIHDGSPLDDRVVSLDYREEQRSDRWRLYFQRSKQQPKIEDDDDLVLVGGNHGYWEVSPHPKGVQVSIESFYDPGGSVPKFLVRWFAGGGVQKMMLELRSYAERKAKEQR